MHSQPSSFCYHPIPNVFFCSCLMNLYGCFFWVSLDHSRPNHRLFVFFSWSRLFCNLVRLNFHLLSVVFFVTCFSLVFKGRFIISFTALVRHSRCCFFAFLSLFLDSPGSVFGGRLWPHTWSLASRYRRWLGGGMKTVEVFAIPKRRRR